MGIMVYLQYKCAGLWSTKRLLPVARLTRRMHWSDTILEDRVDIRQLAPHRFDLLGEDMCDVSLSRFANNQTMSQHDLASIRT
jgi:hypothetical protein